MADVHNPEQRSRNMAAIKGKNTNPEIRVRSLLHSLGYRFRLHRKDLPGKPDIVLPKYRTVIFVHGCFWHCHECRWGSVVPKTRAEFWSVKRRGNVGRDQRQRAELESAGWKVMIVWECEARNTEALKAALEKLSVFSQRM
ncbi:MAG: DNA mismatch endonuclease Vsr [Bryobacteraceae bacterium]